MTGLANTTEWTSLFVKKLKPGTETEEGRLRLKLLERLNGELSEWAGRYRLPRRRLEGSTYTGLYMVSSPPDYQAARELARYVFWFYTLDGFLDDLDYNKLSGKDAGKARVAQKVAYLDSLLNLIIQPLYQIGGLTTKQAHQSGLNPAVALKLENAEVLAQAEGLAASFADLCQTLKDYSGAGLAVRTEGRAGLFSKLVSELAAMLGAVRLELYQRFCLEQAQAEGQEFILLDLEEYLARAAKTCSIRILGIIALMFDKAVASSQTDQTFPGEQDANWQERWQRAQLALGHCAAVARLVNDLAHFRQDLAVGQINAVGIFLTSQGFSFERHAQLITALETTDPPTSQLAELLEKSVKLAGRRLREEISRFTGEARQLPAPQQSLLTHCLCAVVAFLPEMYRNLLGDYLIPE